MTLHSEKVNRKTKKRKNGTAQYRTFCDTVPCRQAKAEEISPLAEHMPIKTKGVFLYGICIRYRIFPLCAVFTKPHSLRQTYWGKKPAGKLCARIDLNSFAGDAQAWC